MTGRRRGSGRLSGLLRAAGRLIAPALLLAAAAGFPFVWLRPAVPARVGWATLGVVVAGWAASRLTLALATAGADSSSNRPRRVWAGPLGLVLTAAVLAVVPALLRHVDPPVTVALLDLVLVAGALVPPGRVPARADAGTAGFVAGVALLTAAVCAVPGWAQQQVGVSTPSPPYAAAGFVGPTARTGHVPQSGLTQLQVTGVPASRLRASYAGAALAPTRVSRTARGWLVTFQVPVRPGCRTELVVSTPPTDAASGIRLVAQSGRWRSPMCGSR